MPDAGLEAKWRERLRAAQEAYSSASARCCTIQAESGVQKVASSEGSLALQQALRAENEARAEYMRVLDIFTRFLLHGEIPGDEESA